MRETLIISAVGMGLVFVGLVVLWWMMAAVVSLSNVQKQVKIDAAAITSVTDSEINDKRKFIAAAAAVSIAIALNKAPTSQSNKQNGTGISPWQAVHRSRQNWTAQHFLRRKE